MANGRIQKRRKSASAWAQSNEILLEGEEGLELGPKPYRRKTGDGVTAWNALPYDLGKDELDEAFENSKIHFGNSFSGAGTEDNPLEVDGGGGGVGSPDTRADIIEKINSNGSDKINASVIEENEAQMFVTEEEKSEWNEKLSPEAILRDSLLAILGTVPPENLPEAPLSETQFEYDAITGKIFIRNGLLGGVSDIGAALRTLPGYDPADTNKILYADMTWGPVPESGNLEQIATPVLTIGAAQVDSLPLTWAAVMGATNYVVQRDTAINFLTPVTVYTGTALGQIDIGLSADTTYYYRIKASGPGYSSSNYGSASKKTTATGSTTPSAPTSPVTNDSINTFGFNIVPGIALAGNYEYTVDGGTTVQDVTANPIVIGNIAKANGQIGVRVKAASGRNASPWLFNTQPFTITLITPPAPSSMVVNDIADTVTVTPPNGYTATDLETSIDNGVTYYPHTANAFAVGNVALAIGMVKSRVKAATGRNAGPVISNTTAFTVAAPGIGDATPVAFSDLVEPAGLVLNGNNFTVDLTSSQYGWASSKLKMPIGGIGYVMYDMNETVTSGTNMSIVLGVSKGTNKEGDNMDYRMYTVSGHQLMGGIKGTYNKSASVPTSPNSKARMRFTGTQVITEVTADAGTSWTAVNTAAQQQTDEMYIKFFTEAAGVVLNNVVYSGFTAI